MSASDVIARLRELRANATGPYWSCKPAVPGAKQMFYLSGNHDANNREVDIGTIQGGYYSCEHNAAAIVAAMNSLESLLACAAQLEKLTEAASCIRHWHDAMADGSGMVVSAEHVRKLWDATEQARRALQALAEGGGS